jgi:hypothetical protein
MVRRAPYAYVALLVVQVVLSVSALLGAVAYYHASQAAQRAQGAAFEKRLCTSLDRLAGLTPPPGPAEANPSRAYLLQQHQVLAELGPDVGCGSTRR